MLPCVICGGTGVQAAHIRYGQRGGIGLKPGDDHITPLCHFHHAEQHHFTTGEKTEKSAEEKWWDSKGIDPLEVAVVLHGLYERYNNLESFDLAEKYLWGLWNTNSRTRKSGTW